MLSSRASSPADTPKRPLHPALDAFFEPAPEGGHRLYLHHTPAPGRPVRGAVLYLHPFAEEMNKSRRMAALTSRALAADGWAVLQIDLLGCGDSSGDFGDASWDAWLDDVARAARWLQGRHPGAPLWLWGLRAGTLLAAAAAPRIGGPLNLLFWQPVAQGKVLLAQFLRLKAAAHLADGTGAALLAKTRAQLAAGETVSVAGYALNHRLAQGLGDARLVPPAPCPSAVAPRAVWLEVTGQASAEPSPATSAALPQWQAIGWRTEACAVAGPAFWQTVEIEDVPALVELTATRLATADSAAVATPSSSPGGE